ncbi:PAS domain S-box protein [Thiomicrorhabdus sp.]|uniref:PAS domain S-box protein n=1 Tax=Thiomicrorhabdus sp. TaxID=2039724 RepID=UPI0029C9740F|nr:PAS domain S-box protein [Thiomicrorhabdus sp.]
MGGWRAKVGDWLQSFTPLKLHRIIDSLNDTVIVIEKHNRLHYANQHWFRLTGHSPQKQLRSGIFRFHPSGRPGRLAGGISEISPKQRNANCCGCALLDIDGEIHWCEIRLQPIYPNCPYPLSATLCDITPQIRSDQIKEARYRSLNSLVNRVPAMIYPLAKQCSLDDGIRQ